MKKYSLNGFTLVEIMVTIAISAMAMTIGVVKYVDFNKTQTIKSAGLILKNNLRDIQTKAATGVKPVTAICNDPATLEGYLVTFNSRTQYQSEAQCSVDKPSGTIVTYDLTELTPGTYFPATLPGTFLFKVLGNGTDVARTIILQNDLTTPTKWYSLCVATSGEIVDCGYSTSTPSCTCT